MLPRLRLVVASLTVVLALIGVAFGLLSGARNGSVFAIGLRSAQGSPVERALPEPPDWREVVALAAARRADELTRLLELPSNSPAVPDTAMPADAAAPVAGAHDDAGNRATTTRPCENSEAHFGRRRMSG